MHNPVLSTVNTVKRVSPWRGLLSWRGEISGFVVGNFVFTSQLYLTLSKPLPGG